ncbi:hypothetical protein XENOCAPTIV_018784 [Xenoophorus captivus]|uniref:Uncharacterized protein n=1 Tax=Xenoophorus captivus TaxID=1517983 RepID=A0ABV0QIY6_9TELE
MLSSLQLSAQVFRKILFWVLGWSWKMADFTSADPFLCLFCHVLDHYSVERSSDNLFLVFGRGSAAGFSGPSGENQAQRHKSSIVNMSMSIFIGISICFM